MDYTVGLAITGFFIGAFLDWILALSEIGGTVLIIICTILGVVLGRWVDSNELAAEIQRFEEEERKKEEEHAFVEKMRGTTLYKEIVAEDRAYIMNGIIAAAKEKGRLELDSFVVGYDGSLQVGNIQRKARNLGYRNITDNEAKALLKAIGTTQGYSYEYGKVWLDRDYWLPIARIEIAKAESARKSIF